MELTFQTALVVTSANQLNFNNVKHNVNNILFNELEVFNCRQKVQEKVQMASEPIYKGEGQHSHSWVFK